jgi:hypothetical protein
VAPVFCLPAPSRFEVFTVTTQYSPSGAELLALHSLFGLEPATDGYLDVVAGRAKAGKGKGRRELVEAGKGLGARNWGWLGRALSR